MFSFSKTGLLRRDAPRKDDKRVNKIPYFEVISMGFPPQVGEGLAMTTVEVIEEEEQPPTPPPC